jgi:2-polyprenyl-3-methyl-5-hydroxy-6-metoxy-1,4-benzoquinol methylase
MSVHAQEVDAGERFEFGENWRRFLSVVNDDRVSEARLSLQNWLSLQTLEGLTVLDIGCGSGLFSLAAAQLGAERVHSIDFDPSSVACAGELKRRFLPGAEQWSIEEGSALDADYIRSLGQFDIVYSWGVLHHTGDMHRALENAAIPVAPGGRLVVSIYNDQGRNSRIWRRIKKGYLAVPKWLRTAYVVLVMAPRELRQLWASKFHPGSYLRSWTDYHKQRGMSRWHDLVDWVGGYPFEVAKPEEIFDFYSERGFVLKRLKTCAGGLGCNEYLFEKAH